MAFSIGIGDIIAVANLAHKLFRDCYTVARRAPQEFQLLLGEISELSNALKILQDDVQNPQSILVQAGEKRVKMASDIASRIGVTLNKLEDVARKYDVLKDGGKSKRFWERIKWAKEFKSIDSIRSKLVYHNTVMNLLLTSISNSSLERIESSNQRLHADIKEIKLFLHTSSTRSQDAPSTGPVLSIVEDDFIKCSLGEALMKSAETLQPWGTIGVNQWIRAGKWWLLKFQMESQYVTSAGMTLSLQGYTNLVKSSWILIDVLASHPQFSFLPLSTHHEVMVLSTEIKQKLRRIDDLRLIVPDLSKIEDQDLRIWEENSGELKLQPRHSRQASNLTRTDDQFWHVNEGKILFQRFALFPDSVQPTRGKPLTCVVLVILDEEERGARVVAQDQNELELVVHPVWRYMYLHMAEKSVTITGKEYTNIVGVLTFPAFEDARYFLAIVDSVKVFLFETCPGFITTDELNALILMYAVKNGCTDEELRMKKTLTTQSLPLKPDSEDELTAVAFNMASKPSQSLKRAWEWHIFQWAAASGDITLLQLLVKKGLNINALCPVGWLEDKTPLMAAIYGGQEEAVRFLLEHGAKATIKCSRAVCSLDLDTHDSLLHYAASFDNTSTGMMRLLVEVVGNVNYRSQKYTDTPLHSAVFYGNVKVVKVLLEEGADIEATGRGNERPLHRAAMHDQDAFILLLLEKGAKVDMPDSSERTALHYAAEHGNVLVVRLLLAHGADPALKEKGGQTPLDLAVMSEKCWKGLWSSGEHKLEVIDILKSLHHPDPLVLR